MQGWVLGTWLLDKLALLMNQDIMAYSYDHMRWLNNLTQETVCLWRRVGNERICVLQFESPHELRMVAEPGKPVPLYCGGAGKILLAYLKPQELDEYFKNVQLKPVGPRTIVDENQLRRELSRINVKGVAVGIKERTSGGVGIAAPIYTADGQVEYCLSLYLPVLRFSNKVKQQLIPLLKKSASDISTDLGFRGSDVIVSRVSK
ncbi:MAG: IclR family transcriptional regulator [Nitrospirota bacterium]